MMPIIIAYLLFGAAVTTMWVLYRASEKRRARQCRDMAFNLLIRANHLREEEHSSPLLQARALHKANLLSKEADYWFERARHWENGDI